MKNFLMDKDNTVLVGIDFQEKLMPAMKNSDDVQDKTVKLIKGCRTLGIPMIFTQQYTKGLGMSTEKIQKAVTDKEFSWIEKSSFSAVGSPEFLDRLRAEGRNTVLMSGVEALTATVHDIECAGASSSSPSGTATPSTREYSSHVTKVEADRRAHV